MDTTFTIIILIGYLITLVIIGFYSQKKARTVNGFFVANRNLGTIVCTAAIASTVIGGSATIVAGGLIYRSGLPALWIDIGGALGLIILGFFLAKKVRKTGLFTLPEITGKLYNDNVRYASAILIIIIEIAWVSLLIQTTSLILSVVFPLEFEFILIAVTIVFISYTLLGGQYAVVYTDLIQSIVMIIGICFIAAPLLLIDALPHLHQLPINHLSFPINNDFGILAAAAFFIMFLMPHIVGPDIYSKILSAKNEKTAKYSAISAGFLKFIFAVAIGIIAISVTVLYPASQYTALQETPALAIPTAVANINPILAGLILASFISVMLSSADTCLLSAGTILSVDITRRNNVKISRIGILTVGVGALILSLYLGSVIDTLKLAYTVFTAGLTLPILFGFYKEKTRVSSKGAFWSLILGGSISLIWFYLETTFFKSYYTNISYAVLVGLLVSIFPLIVFREVKK